MPTILPESAQLELLAQAIKAETDGMLYANDRELSGLIAENRGTALCEILHILRDHGGEADVSYQVAREIADWVVNREVFDSSPVSES